MLRLINLLILLLYAFKILIWNLCRFLHGKNNFAERSKIPLDTGLKIILVNHQNNFIGNLSWLLEYQIFCSIAHRSLVSNTIILIPN